jgi:shikimate kinase
VTGPQVVLVGIMGAGKTTVGGLLATQLGMDFRDLDEHIEALAGKPIPDIFVDHGEPHFRALERDAVAASLTGFVGVLALGGGSVMDPRTRADLREHTVVYLSVELSDAVRRVGMGQGRPMLALNPRARLRQLMEQRRPLYEEVASYTVATSGRTPDEVTIQVLSCLRRSGTPHRS